MACRHPHGRRGRLAGALIAGTLGLLGAVPAWAAEAVAPSLIIVQPPEPPSYGLRLPRSPFDHARLGLAHFQDPALTELFGAGGVSLGLDWPLAGGLALSLDSMHLRRVDEASAYWLSINPLQLRYRLGLGFPAPGVAPFATAGGGVTVMTLSGDADRTRLGLGPAFSGSLGAVIHDAVSIEMGLSAGQVGQIPYWGWQLRAGTGFDALGRWPGGPAAAQAPAAPARPAVAVRDLQGRVLEVAGDRLVIGYDRAPTEGVGDELLVYYEDGVAIKVARARVVALEPDGRAIAEVLARTEPVRHGYLVRGW